MDRRRPGRHLGLLRVVLVLLLIALVAPARTAAAAQMSHHDLRSLALISDAIVRVRVLAEPEQPGAPVDHQVLACYLGALEVGATLRLAHAGYSSQSGPFSATTRVFDDEAVLFLQRARAGDATAWRLAPSGLRRRSEGIVYRYYQAKNPGPYVSVSQGHDPFDVYGDPRGGPGLSMAEFEVELQAAIVGAAAIRADLRRIDDPAARARLLAAIGPARGDDRDEPAALWMHALEDSARDTIIEELWRAGHRDDALAGVDRLPLPLGYWNLPLDVDPAWLLALASDPRRPTPIRRGALLLLEHRTNALSPPDALQRLIALLADPDPELRALAAGVDMAAQGTPDPRWVEALRARIRDDDAPAARLALLTALADATRPDASSLRLTALGLPDAAWPVVAAHRRGRAFAVEWATPRPGWEFEGFELRARPGRGSDPERPWTPSGRSFPVQVVSGELVHGSARDWLLFDPELDDRAVEFDVRVRFSRSDEVKVVEVALRGLPSLGAVSSRVDGADRAAPAPIPAPSGCACRPAEREGGRAASGTLVLVLVLRRRRRPDGHSPGPATDRARSALPPGRPSRNPPRALF